MLCLWTRYDILCVPRWWYRWRGKGTKVNILLSSVSRITPLHIYHTLPLHLVSLDRNFQIWWTCTDGMAGGDHVTDASAGHQWWVAGAYKTTSVSGVWLRQTKHTLLVSRPFHSCCWPPYVSLCNGTITLSKAQLCYRLTVIPLNPTWLQHTKFELPRWGLFPSNYPWLQMSLATRCGNSLEDCREASLVLDGGMRSLEGRVPEVALLHQERRLCVLRGGEQEEVRGKGSRA